MKLQELDKSVTIAWSCLPAQPALLAGGTVAGSLDSNFDTSAHLEILSLDLARPSKPLQVLGSTTAPDRFHKLCWGMTGVSNETFPQGIIAGGLANGTVNLWDAAKIISGAPNPLIACVERHSSGPVQGLDFNPFVPNLLASGGSDAEILIWDLSNAASPTVYTPAAGAKPQEAAITCVAWNRKVQHILASSSLSGVTVVWDLKNKRAILNLAEPTRKLRCRSIAWHPDEATQIVTSSEDDSAPILQLWDLRNTYSPVSTLEGHTRGVFSVSWSSKDTDLLLSCGKDNRTLCWNVRTGEIQCEVDGSATGFNFNIDVQWSPRLPALLATTSLEGKLGIHSLADVRTAPAPPQAADYLGNIPQPAVSKTPSVPPKWLRRPAGVSFGFGGKLVWFKPPAPGQTGPRRVVLVRLVSEQPLVQRAERLEQALNQEDFKSYCLEKIEQSTSADDKATWSLLKVLFEQNQRQEILSYLGYDPDKVADEVKQYSARLKLKQLSLAEPAAAAAPASPLSKPQQQQDHEPTLSPSSDAADPSAASSSSSSTSSDTTAAVTSPASPPPAPVEETAAAAAVSTEAAADSQQPPEQPQAAPLSSSGSVDQLFGGSSGGAGSNDVSGLFSADGDAETTSVFDSFATASAHPPAVSTAVSPPATPSSPAARSLAPNASFGSDSALLLQQAKSSAAANSGNGANNKGAAAAVEHFLLLPPSAASPSSSGTEDNGEGLVTRALMVGNFELAVDCCIETGRMADALVLAAYGGPDLWSKTQEAYFRAQSKPYMKVISAIVRDELNTLVLESAMSHWHAVLAILCTYAKREDFPIYAGLLGDRLVQEARDTHGAILCYLCAGHLDKTVDLWLANKQQLQQQQQQQQQQQPQGDGADKSHQSLQSLIEKIAVFRRAINHQEPLRPIIAERYAQYAEILASQGLLSNATRCLAFLAQSRNDDTTVGPFVLLDRLHHAQDAKGAPPPFPFKREDVLPSPAAVSQHTATTPAVSAPAVAAAAAHQQQHAATASAASPWGQPQQLPQATSYQQQPPGSYGQQQPQPQQQQTYGTTAAPAVQAQPAYGQPHPGQQYTTAPAANPYQAVQTPYQQQGAFTGGSTGGYVPTTQQHAYQPQPQTQTQQPMSVGGPNVMRPMVPAAPAAASPAPPTATAAAPPPQQSAYGAAPVSAQPPQARGPPSQPATPAAPPSAPAPAPQQPATPAAPPPQQQAVATSADNQQLIDGFNAVMQSRHAIRDPKVVKLMADVSKRLEQLQQKLARNEYPPVITAFFHQIIQALLAGDSRAALGVFQQLNTEHFDAVGPMVMLGIKRLVESFK